MTIFNWKCNLYNKNYNNKNPRYYCSICDYNMCEDCYTNKNYPKKAPFPNNVTPSINSINEKYFDAANHDHKLVYCRTSRNDEKLNTWLFDNCRESYIMRLGLFIA